MSQIVGACSNCGAMIVRPEFWFSTIPWIPTCDRCGATKKLPIIEMDKPRIKEIQNEKTKTTKDN